MQITIEGRQLWINYHHLYCFFIIASEGSLTRASQKLGIGPSALSIQMKQFEDHLGFSLFERSHRKLSPNERGKILVVYAKEIFRLGNEMIEAAFDRPTARRTHLKIGSIDAIPKHLTTALVRQALLAKNCSLSVIEGGPDLLLEALKEHKIDLVLMNFLPLSQAGQFYSKRIARLPLWVVGGNRFRKLKKNFPASLDGAPFILSTADSHVRHEVENYFKAKDIRPDYLAETQDAMVQKLLAIDQLGLTVMPKYAVRDYVARKDLFLIAKLTGLYEEIFLVSASRKIQNPVAALLMHHFQLS